MKKTIEVDLIGNDGRHVSEIPSLSIRSSERQVNGTSRRLETLEIEVKFDDGSTRVYRVDEELERLAERINPETGLEDLNAQPTYRWVKVLTR